MKPMICVFLLFTSMAGAQTYVSLMGNFGGNVPFLGYEFPDAINVTDKGVNLSAYAGGGVQFHLNEYLQFGMECNYELSGEEFDGNIINLVNGRIEYRYKYLHFPAYIKASIPLMVPGSVFLAVGPDLAMNIGAIYEWHTGTLSQEIDIDTSTAPVDFGIHASAGYDLPLSWIVGLLFHVDYYHGFIDIYDDEDQPSSNRIELYNRSVKFGISLYVNIGATAP
jgi:hypothetical protein